MSLTFIGMIDWWLWDQSILADDLAALQNNFKLAHESRTFQKYRDLSTNRLEDTLVNLTVSKKYMFMLQGNFAACMVTSRVANNLFLGVNLLDPVRALINDVLPQLV